MYLHRAEDPQSNVAQDSFVVERLCSLLGFEDLEVVNPDSKEAEQGKGDETDVCHSHTCLTPVLQLAFRTSLLAYVTATIEQSGDVMC